MFRFTPIANDFGLSAAAGPTTRTTLETAFGGVPGYLGRGNTPLFVRGDHWLAGHLGHAEITVGLWDWDSRSARVFVDGFEVGVLVEVGHA